ncbi:hypothetical protein BaRGS_00018609 [Batillaria attramentaria]|uniref:MAM domain-containing protein n=1 Tax=Batillaria attramentaria TaxID=370345 RepID=A0ABD0KSI2_9CAEN
MLKPKPRVICSAIFVGLLATVQSQADEKRCVSASDTKNLQQNDDGRFYYSSVNTTALSANSSTRLASPWLCAAEHGAYSFSFLYYLPDNSLDSCRLSVLLSAGDNTRPVKIWTATSATRTPYRFFKFVSPILIICRETPFQIYFEAEKLSSISCGEFHEIGIDNIKIEYSTSLDGSFFTCPNPRSTDEPQAASNAGFHQYEPTPGPDTASRGIHSDYELASDPAGHYSTPHTAPDRAAVNAGTRGQHGDASSSYNELSFEAQRPKQGARTYDHLKQ